MKTKSTRDAKTGKAMLCVGIATAMLVFALASCGGGKTDDPPPAVVGQGLSRQEIIERLTLPDSTLDATESGGASISSLTDYPDALIFYENRLAELGFVSTIPAEYQALMEVDPTSKLYTGKIGEIPVTIQIRDWSDTFGNGDMTLVQISFMAYGE